MDEGANRVADHDDVGAELRSWFTRSSPEIGVEVEELWGGYLNRHPAGPVRFFATIDDPSMAPRALREVAERCDTTQLVVCVDDRDRAAVLGGALARAGFQQVNAVTHLALVGQMAEWSGPAGLVVREVFEDEMETWAVVKVKSFADDESPPSPQQVAEEAKVRRSEATIASYVLASHSGQDVAVLAYYEGERVELVFNLGTRVPWRHQGIARALLRHWVDLARPTEPRALVINADDGGLPAHLYRELGFRDEVYWYQRYRRPV